MQKQQQSAKTGQAVKKTLLIFGLLAAAVSGQGQFSTPAQLNNYFRDSMTDRSNIKAFTLRKALTGINNLHSSNYLFKSRLTFSGQTGQMWEIDTTGGGFDVSLGLTKDAVYLDNVDNVSDINKPISTATQAALNLKAPLSSPNFSGSVAFNRTVITSSTTLNNTHYYVAADALVGAITVTLPYAATCTGRQYFIKKIDATAHAITIACTGSETIEGLNPIYLGSQWQYLWVMAGTTGWEILGALD